MAKFGFITIEAGVLIASVDDEVVWHDAATGDNARNLGRWTEENHPDADWFFSSSIDFPHEYGAPRINFRVAIAEGAKREVFDPINFGETP